MCLIRYYLIQATLLTVVDAYTTTAMQGSITIASNKEVVAQVNYNTKGYPSEPYISRYSEVPPPPHDILLPQPSAYDPGSKCVASDFPGDHICNASLCVPDVVHKDMTPQQQAGVDWGTTMSKQATGASEKIVEAGVQGGFKEFSKMVGLVVPDCLPIIGIFSGLFEGLIGPAKKTPCMKPECIWAEVQNYVEEVVDEKIMDYYVSQMEATWNGTQEQMATAVLAFQNIPQGDRMPCKPLKKPPNYNAMFCGVKHDLEEIYASLNKLGGEVVPSTAPPKSAVYFANLATAHIRVMLTLLLSGEIDYSNMAMQKTFSEQINHYLTQIPAVAKSITASRLAAVSPVQNQYMASGDCIAQTTYSGNAWDGYKPASCDVRRQWWASGQDTGKGGGDFGECTWPTYTITGYGSKCPYEMNNVGMGPRVCPSPPPDDACSCDSSITTVDNVAARASEACLCYRKAWLEAQYDAVFSTTVYRQVAQWKEIKALIDNLKCGPNYCGVPNATATCPPTTYPGADYPNICYNTAAFAASDGQGSTRNDWCCRAYNNATQKPDAYCNPDWSYYNTPAFAGWAPALCH